MKPYVEPLSTKKFKIVNTSHCAELDELIDMIMSGSKDIFSRVYGLREVQTIKKCLHIKENQHACILLRCGNTLKAYVFFIIWGTQFLSQITLEALFHF